MQMNHPHHDAAEHVKHVQNLFLRHHFRIKGFLLGLLGNINEVDDLLQEVFITLTDKADQYQRDTNFVHWACTVAKFKVLEHQRNNRRHQQFLPPELVNQLAETAANESHFESDFPEEMMQALDECVNNLAPAARQILDLRYQEDQQPGRIATVLGMTPGSVYATLSRIRAFLRKCVTQRLDIQGDKP